MRLPSFKRFQVKSPSSNSKVPQLPDDILYIIFDHLESEALKSSVSILPPQYEAKELVDAATARYALSSCYSVSKLWRAIALKFVWKEITIFKFGYSPKFRKSLRRFLKLLEQDVVIARSIKAVTFQMNLQVFRTIDRLRGFSRSEEKFQQEKVLIESIVKCLPNLKSLHLKDFPDSYIFPLLTEVNISFLHLEITSSFRPYLLCETLDIPRYLQSLPNSLLSLNVDLLALTSDMHHSLSLPSYSADFPNLKSLTIRCYFLNTIPSSFISWLLKGCPNIDQLKIGSRLVSGLSLEEDASSASNIKEFHLEGDLIHPTEIRPFLECLKNLTILAVSESMSPTIISYLPNTVKTLIIVVSLSRCCCCFPSHKSRVVEFLQSGKSNAKRLEFQAESKLVYEAEILEVKTIVKNMDGKGPLLSVKELKDNLKIVLEIRNDSR